MTDEAFEPPDTHGSAPAESPSRLWAICALLAGAGVLRAGANLIAALTRDGARQIDVGVLEPAWLSTLEGSVFAAKLVFGIALLAVSLGALAHRRGVHAYAVRVLRVGVFFELGVGGMFVGTMLWRLQYAPTVPATATGNAAWAAMGTVLVGALVATLLWAFAKAALYRSVLRHLEDGRATQ